MYVRMYVDTDTQEETGSTVHSVLGLVLHLLVVPEILKHLNILEHYINSLVLEILFFSSSRVHFVYDV